KVAIAELTLSVPAGSVFALLGENSAGKTTSLKMLMGLLQPTSGRVRLLGQDAWAHAAQLRPRLGYVPEKPRFYDWMSVAEIGWFAAGFLPAGSLERYQSWTQRLGLEPSVKLRHLSKGHYSKVALALAMAGDPEVLILDEPTSGLDLLVRREFLGSMVDLAAGGRTVVIASHQISEIERIASHVAFLSAGKLLLTAPLDDLRQRLVRVTGSGALPADLAGLGQILERRVSDGQWEMVLLDPTADALAQLEARPDLGSLATTPLSLEEAYTALLSQREAA
ncbi:MAG TPA: ABC transporter ATP-binding protein, partial [Gemmatales bacterium]|nr:ABC transporter ATP-binding protein [Gemmatales bacterium]